MDNGKLDVATDYSVTALTKWIMQKYSLNQAQALWKLAETKLYELIMDPETGLCLETTFRHYFEILLSLPFDSGKIESANEIAVFLRRVGFD